MYSGGPPWQALLNPRLRLIPDQELLGKEAEIIGCSDHLLEELPILLEFLRQGRIDLSHVITDSVSLDADAINKVLEELEQFKGHVRTVIKPNR